MYTTIYPKTASVQDVQRNYRSLFDDVIDDKTPLFVLNNNKPEVVIIEVHQFEAMQNQAHLYEIEMAKQAVEVAHKEKQAGKLKKLKSLADLMK